MADEQIIELRDRLLPSQGEAFDCIAFARALLEQGQAKAMRDERLAVAFSDAITHQCIGMQCAMIEARFSGAEKAMTWIANTLEGPGLIPDYSAALALNATNPAQAWCDAKFAEHEAHRTANPGP